MIRIKYLQKLEGGIKKRSNSKRCQWNFGAEKFVKKIFIEKMYNDTYVIFQFECLRVIVPDLIGFGKSDKFVDYRAYNIRQGNFNVILLNFVCLSVWNT